MKTTGTSPAKGLQLLAILGVLGLAPALTLQAQVTAWADTPAPRIDAVVPLAEDPATLRVSLTMATGSAGADSIVVALLDAQGREVAAKTLGRARAAERTADFTPGASGTWRVEVRALRRAEAEPKLARSGPIAFRLPLARPEPSIRNRGAGTLEATWAPVPEAEAYTLVLSDPQGRQTSSGRLTEPRATFSGLAVGTRYQASLQIHRGSETVSTAPQAVTARHDADRDWTFTRFGQSSSAEANTFRMLDQDAFRFRLDSATFDAQGNILLKGGKFTTFHDGISFYYTPIKAATENFELSATFTIDAMNPTPDGQEGFGLLVMDSLGAHEVSSVNHYTNSAGIIATKFEETIDGVKYTSKDTLGSRFVWGITPPVLAGGDSAIAQQARNRSQGFDYGSHALIQAGQSWRLTLIKDNTGYHTRWQDPRNPDAPPVVRTLYGPDKLLALDPDHVYLGFAVARGVNATVSDVVFKVSDPRTDPPGKPEPPNWLPLSTRIQSPDTSGDPAYTLAWSSNSPGRLTVRDQRQRVIAQDVPVVPDTLWTKAVRLSTGANIFRFSFVPDPEWEPAENTRLGVWSPAAQAYGPPPGPVEQDITVYHRSYPGSVIYVGPYGNSRGTGARNKPLNLATALAFVKPGQAIELAGGIYNLREGITIARGNSGTETKPKVLRAAPGTRAILDFSQAGAGMQVWGDWWLISGIDIRRTPGNVKGLQIAGHHNVVNQVRAYFNGDTGIQISGSSAEPPSWWPSHNRVEYSTSFDNMDPAANNADGFAAKITVGAGNVFSWCMAYGNIDDGWDLFTKIESGPIPPVLIEHSVAFRNGSLSNGQGNGDGNGFKLGGDGIAVAHVLRNSLAFENGAAGITSNSNPAIILEYNTVYANRGANITLYGKGSSPLEFTVTGVLSLAGGAADNVPPANSGPTNYLWTGAESVNSLGVKFTRADFEVSDPRTFLAPPSAQPDDSEASTWPELPREWDGSFAVPAFFVPRDTTAFPVGWRP